MKWKLFILFILFCSSGCEYRVKEDLKKREKMLDEKEQLIILKEKQLQEREESLAKREQLLDSAANGARQLNDTIIGKWNVTMTCTESTCSGSAVGDSKSESWQLSYQSSTLVAKVSVNEKIVRIYTGFYKENTIELVDNVADTAIHSATKMTVRLTMSDADHMEGYREIVRDNSCKVVYAVRLEKNID
jgi:hypothetical protein